MRRLLLLLPLCVIGGCYPYGPYDDDGYYAYHRPYPSGYSQGYAPAGQAPYYPPQSYAPNDQARYQGYRPPGYPVPERYQPPPNEQGSAQPTYLAPEQDQSQRAYQGDSQWPYATPAPSYQGEPQHYGYQGQPHYYGGTQPGYGEQPPNCGTLEQPRPCY